jgi:hypothetical protein
MYFADIKPLYSKETPTDLIIQTYTSIRVFAGETNISCGGGEGDLIEAIR